MIRFSVLSLFVLLLMGCSFNGIMSESYDGKKITADEEAVELYEEENLLKTEGLESRYAFLNSDTVFEGLRDGGTEITLSPGHYVIGEDVEPGRYSAATEEASAIVVYDENGDRLLETALNYFNTNAVLELQEGYRVEYVTRRGPIDLIPSEEKYDSMIPAGIHTVGEHLEAGTYILLTKELPVRRLNSEDEVYMNPGGMGSVSLSSTDVEIDTELSIKVELHEGDTIVSEHPVVLEKD